MCVFKKFKELFTLFIIIKVDACMCIKTKKKEVSFKNFFLIFKVGKKF